MKKIKFRAWDGERMILWNDLPEYYHLDMILDEPNGDPKVMQFTGLRDKNGNEIYEGDLLDFDEREWGGQFTPEIINMDNLIGEWGYCGSLSDVKKWRQIIGNIYETPERVPKST